MNAAIIFQCLRTQVFRGLNWKFLLIYIDDILIFINSFEEHLRHLLRVLINKEPPIHTVKLRLKEVRVQCKNR